MVLAAGAGLVSGTASAVFLICLGAVTTLREEYSQLIWFLPLAGVVVSWMDQAFGRGLEGGHALILDEIHDPRRVLPTRLLPLVFIGTLVTHLCGGSAGREGTAVQMGAALSDRLGLRFKLSAAERGVLLRAGMSGGFGSVFGVPWAGALFGLEVLGLKNLRASAIVPCVIASWVGHHVTLAWGVRHASFAWPEPPPVSVMMLAGLVGAGVLFGACAQIFVRTTHLVSRVGRGSRARPVVGGVVVALGHVVLHSTRYAGLGVPVIAESLRQPVGFEDFALKLAFTAVTLGSGFRGGEVTPLLFIGATLGSGLSTWFGFTPAVLGALGFSAVFAGAAHVPLVGAVMAAEIFGPAIGGCALIACGVSHVCAGRVGIYGRRR